MGSLLPLSITTNCTMKSLLILATVLAVGHSEETKAVNVAPYNYGFPGYYGGVAAPFVHPQVAPVNYAYAPQTAYPYTYAPYAQAYAPVAAPVAAAAPVYATPAVIPPLSSQFHAGDEFGNSQYGYSNLNSAKHEIGNAFGQKSGSYQYVDPAGNLQTVTYVADELGFRVVDSRLPVAPVHNAELPVAPVHEYELPVAPVHVYELPVAPVYDGVAPASVEVTPEVAAATAEHLAAVAEVASREKRESDPMVSGYGYNSPWLLNKAYQRPMYNGVYAYNMMANAGYYNPRFSYGFYY